jgi:hypothetical protein
MRLRRTLVAITASCFLSLGLQTTTASAGVIGTAEYLSATDRAGQVASVQAVLSRADVRAQLEKYGVDPADAVARSPMYRPGWTPCPRAATGSSP